MFVCSVCYEPFNYDVNPASLPCGHVFCEGDIRRIPAYGSSQCPTCRKPFTPRDIRKVYMACDLNSRSDHGLSASQHQSAEILAAQMRDLDISATDNEIARVLGGARAWSRSLEGISDKKVKTSLARFTLSLDLANARVLETSYLRDQLKQARSEQTRLNAKLQEESRRFNAALSEQVIQAASADDE
ncbi:hypothetical protein BD410DRAFT_838475 [Rickenella mellea]|uniref:RING-type domain-containing protein n=1 Tax=Rickenella mellea TaxID=50990 RepID=A0A4Y7Q9P6_9AGAM|nr:hypothetical protein BD410DRAFT_838475 [Rickenella mellea]